LTRLFVFPHLFFFFLRNSLFRLDGVTLVSKRLARFPAGYALCFFSGKTLLFLPFPGGLADGFSSACLLQVKKTLIGRFPDPACPFLSPRRLLNLYPLWPISFRWLHAVLFGASDGRTFHHLIKTESRSEVLMLFLLL